MSIDPISLSQQLIRCPSVTPDNAGALEVLEAALQPMGFVCERKLFEGDGGEPTDNLYARWGKQGDNLCFAGHVDVVPPGDLSLWDVDPFAAEIRDGTLIGRGTVDMKPAIAAWVAAISRVLEAYPTLPGSLSLLITGDEEGDAVNGTRKMLESLRSRNEMLSACVVGEPTNPERLGDMIKIGRRGSITARLTVHGTQGHVAYPHLAHNPVTDLIRIVHEFTSVTLDEGTEYFQPSNLEVTTIDVGNKADNVIPASASATCNIRFNDRHTSDGLKEILHGLCKKVTDRYELSFRVSGESFLTQPGQLSDVVAQAVEQVTGRAPDLSTTGGTSDARFIKDACPVVECGLINQTAHKVNESVAVEDIERLTQIYRCVIEKYFNLNAN